MGGGAPTSDLVIYGAILIVGVIVLAIFSKIMKQIAERRTKNTTFISMTMDDLERMKQTGLIDDDELKKVKRSVSERMVSATLPTTSRPADLALQEALHDFEEESKGASDSGEIPKPEPQDLPSDIPAPPPAARKKPTLSDVLGDGELSSAPPRKNVEPKPIPAAPMPPPVSAKSDSGAAMPLDIETLRATGAIDEEEYQRLRAYFKRRSKT